MEENILELYLELDKQKFENSAMDFNLIRLLKIRQFVEKIAQKDSLERYHEIKPFSCKFCDQSFGKVHEVKEHVKIPNSISEVKDLKDQVKSLKNQVEELEVKLKSCQKNEFKTEVKVEDEQEMSEPGVKQEGVKNFREQMKDMNQLKEKNNTAKKGKRKCNACKKKPSNIFTKCNHIIPAKISCPQCPNTFSNTYNLKKHLEFVHEGIRVFSCQDCKQTFQTNSTLKVIR
jgi:hypothetical protein